MDPESSEQNPPQRPEISPTDAALRYAQGRKAAAVSVLLNLLLAVAKGVLGGLTGSVALIADAVHTASDVVTSVVVWIGLAVARRPADERHPHGHGRAETIAALVVAVLLAVAGVHLATESVGRMVDPPAVGEWFGGTGLLLVAGFVLATGVAKGWMGWYAARVGRRIENRSLITDAWHHWSDAVSSLLVVAALVLARWEVYGADAWLGLGVSAILVATAVVHGLSASSSLLGERADVGLVERIRSAAGAVHGIRDVHAVSVHDYGTRKVASLHVTLRSGLSLDEAHRASTEVEQRLGHELGLAVHVHAEPQETCLPQHRLDHIRDTVERLLVTHPGIVSFHGLSVQPEDHGLEVEFHAYVPPGTPIEQAHALEHSVTETLERELPDLHVHLHIEPCPLACTPCPDTCGVATEPPEAPTGRTSG